ncbi:MAG: PQQ-binding-like beta-propeller repeat protein, partial [Gemmatimonadales bacterium]
MHKRYQKLALALPLASVLLIAACATTVRSTDAHPTRSRAVDWPAYGYDPGGTRFSPATQINEANVKSLTLAWTYRTGETRPDLAATRQAGRARFESTPIVLDGVMYLNTPLGRVIALDPSTGTQLWTFDARVDRAIDPGDFASRGVTAWIDPAASSGATCAMRIFVGTVDARLIAIDGRTGKACDNFGLHGSVDLKLNLRNPPHSTEAEYVETSPPVILDGRVVIGSSIGDNGRA